MIFTQLISIGRITSELNALFACGRRAILAIIEITFQDGLTSPATEFAKNRNKVNVFQHRATKNKPGCFPL